MSDESVSSRASSHARSAILRDVAVTIRQCQDSASADADLVAAARLLSEDTRRRALPIERAIVEVKTTLLAEVPEIAASDTLATMRARFIQMTIEEYYRAELAGP
jgi:hypothetical protein